MAARRIEKHLPTSGAALSKTQRIIIPYPRKHVRVIHKTYQVEIFISLLAVASDACTT